MFSKNFFQKSALSLFMTLSLGTICSLHAEASQIDLKPTHATEICATRAQITRPLSIQEKQNIEKLRAKTQKEAMKAAKLLGIDMKKGKTKAKGCFPSNPSFKNASLHRIKTRSPKGDLIEIENGAAFTIPGSWDMAKAQTWKANSDIRIYSKSWGSSCDYQLYNVYTGQTVDANLSAGPYLYDPLNPSFLNPANNYLAGVNPMTGDVVLYGGAQYRVSSSAQDLSQLINWKQDDIIIVGDNDTWFGCDFILINIATNSYVAADRTY